MRVILCLAVLFWQGMLSGADPPEAGADILETDILPDDLRLIPAVGNGHLATQVFHDTIYMNGLYSGEGADSHRARIPSCVGINISVSGPITNNYKLDMKRGVFIREIDHADFTIEQRIYAHRTKTRLLVNEFTLDRKNPGDESEIIIDLYNNRGDPSLDFTIVTQEYDAETMHSWGPIKEPETNTSSSPQLEMLWSKVPATVSLAGPNNTATWRFLSSVSIDWADAVAAYEENRNVHHLVLLQSHVNAWENLWTNGHIDVKGNVDLAQTINAALFHILISCPEAADPISPFNGLSPGGLARGGKIVPTNISGPYNDYAGHVFWDMDTWIMPPVMMFHPHLANIMISSRTRVIDAARAHAQNTGYAGARFPWEQAYSGSETCPAPLMTEYQIHITGDVAYSMHQYLYAQNNVDFVNNEQGKELAMEIARFFESRALYNAADDRYEIHGVMGPDEYNYNVNNSVYTNYIAKLSFELPAYMRDKLNISFSVGENLEIAQFNEMAEKLYILFDDVLQYHPQFEGFTTNTTIKQSDVVLLGYPLLMNMTPEIRRNDLEIYEGLTDPTGPDTGTWSMHTVGWLELNNETHANEMFQMMFRNVNGPFKIFSEKPSWSFDGMRATNFITGMGGMLQAVVFGYGGFRIRMHQLDINPYIFLEATEWDMDGVKYRGSTVDFQFRRFQTHFTLRERVAGADDLIFLEADGTRHVIAEGNPVTVNRGAGTFVTVSEEYLRETLAY